MYIIIVLLLMFALPFGTVYWQHAMLHDPAPLLLLVGKWYVFWAVGVRLLLAGLRQQIQPKFTSKEIFGIESDDPLPFVRELGMANFAAGVVGIASIVRPDFLLPAAISGGLFYGLAGVGHITQSNKSTNEMLALVSNLVAFAVLAAYAGSVLLKI